MKYAAVFTSVCTCYNFAECGVPIPKLYHVRPVRNVNCVKRAVTRPRRDSVAPGTRPGCLVLPPRPCFSATESESGAAVTATAGGNFQINFTTLEIHQTNSQIGVQKNTEKTLQNSNGP
ncbi:hypothetical protein EVAR_33487_1 [Eumeta japonica]|uniref:Uncharacterized protein n=1 Tax=Eumeta variegata TaxID=151549 RepID=A0A4C1WGU6_EUMVA|nr:hypothetical protein EVAR_33487_1 [Eumeta japonica]